MLVQPDPTPTEAEVASLPPLCDEAEFAQEIAKLFAVVQEYGERVDGRIAAWGLAFEDYADIVGVDPSTTHLRLQTPERAVRYFSRHPRITARVTWVNAST